MKKERLINFRTNDEDVEVLEKAANKLSSETGEKPNVSKAIRHSAEHYVTSEPELFFCNRPALEQVEKNIEFGREHLQNVLDQYLKVIEGETLTMSEIQSFFGSSRAKFLVTDKEAIETNIRSKKGAKMRKAMPGYLIEDAKIEMPDLTELFEVCGKVIYVPTVLAYDVFYWNCFQVNENKIEVINEAVEQVKGQYRAYAITSEEIEKLRKVKNLCRLLDSFLIHNLSNPSVFNVPNVCYFDGISGRFEADQNFIKYSI